ncbi:hypothetical protein HG537_0F02800 [Torulaspora globosa]|uniref:Peroxin/Ferlin domain-containing protein n=1 Tax=Torulaspora globosa TaxID=48254 RepID=A0A7H9HW51_9SACH|nr:hypothetical protein HG537_0F02800 [Torulaspora sp. CBS 2947]
MRSKSDKDKIFRCRARFVYNHGQKPTLTFVTPSSLSSVLYRLYPLLIIVDGALSNAMWVCEDRCLPFIHLVMVCLMVNLLTFTEQSAGTSWVSLRGLFMCWLGLMSAFVLLVSFAYYVLTIYQDLRDSEPPTLDDIVIVLESVIDKLGTMRAEVLGKLPDTRNWINLLKLALLFTPIHYLLIKMVTIRTYVMWMTILAMLYHSTWFQCTLKLFWRVYPVRKAYYRLTSLFGNNRHIQRSPLIDAQTAIDLCHAFSYIPRTDSIAMVTGHRLQLHLQKLYPWSESIPTTSKQHTTQPHITVVDLTIYENQRKWKDHGWSSRMLSYEKPSFCMKINDRLMACNSPWQFQETLPADWTWLDDCWRPIGWIYSDTNWRATGDRDSLESFTRTKIWKRRAFKE